jgi:hypothetical protein
MNAHKIETVIGANGTIVLKELPFQEGDTVEVVVLEKKAKTETDNPYPLRGKLLKYDEPNLPHLWKIGKC